MSSKTHCRISFGTGCAFCSEMAGDDVFLVECLSSWNKAPGSIPTTQEVEAHPQQQT